MEESRKGPFALSEGHHPPRVELSSQPDLRDFHQHSHVKTCLSSLRCSFVLFHIFPDLIAFELFKIHPFFSKPWAETQDKNSPISKFYRPLGSCPLVLFAKPAADLELSSPLCSRQIRCHQSRGGVRGEAPCAFFFGCLSALADCDDKDCS